MLPLDEEATPDTWGSETYIGGYIDDLRGHDLLGLPWGTPDPRLASFTQVEPASFGFTAGELTGEIHTASFDLAMKHHHFVPRHRVWDVAWQDDEHVIAVDDTCHAEMWHTLAGC